MAVPTPDQAIATLEAGQAELAGLFAKLSDQAMTHPATIGGGDWSAKDLLGHIAYWEELGSEMVADWRAGRPLAIAAIFGGGRATVDAANARDQARNAELSLAEVRARANAAHVALLQTIHGLAPNEWKAQVVRREGTRETLAELLASILGAPKQPFGHAGAHLADLKAYVAQVTDAGASPE